MLQQSYKQSLRSLETNKKTENLRKNLSYKNEQMEIV